MATKKSHVFAQKLGLLWVVIFVMVGNRPGILILGKPGIVTKYVGVVLQILLVGVCWCIVMLMCLIFPPRIQKDIPLREVNSQALDLLLFTSNPASIVVCTPKKHGTSN